MTEIIARAMCGTAILIALILGLLTILRLIVKRAQRKDEDWGRRD